MAGWTYSSWGGRYIHEISEFWWAVNERSARAGFAPLSPPSGYVSATDLNTLRNRILALAPSFIRSHTDAGDLIDYSGASTIESWTAETLLVSLGAPAGTTQFRTADTWPSSASWTDPAFAYRDTAVADYIGSWIFDDCMKALNRLIWTGSRVSVTSSESMAVQSSLHPDRETAILEAEKLWIAEVPTLDTVPPGRVSTVNEVSGEYEAKLEAATATYTKSGLGTITHDVTWFVYARPDDEFDAQGEPVLNSLWSVFDTQTGETSDSNTSATLGSFDLMNWSTNNNVGRGWYTKANDIFIIADYAVAGGFTYF